MSFQGDIKISTGRAISRQKNRYDRKDQGGGSKVEVTSQGMVPMAMAIGTYSDYDSRENGAYEQEHIHLPDLLFKSLVQPGH